MIPLKSAEDLDCMRESCRIAAEVKEAVGAAVLPGITTQELDLLGDKLIREKGAVSAFFGYRGYPGHICVSVNDEVVHGIPGNRIIQMGDIVSIDIGVVYNGFVGDNAKTVMVGVSDPEVIRLVRVAEEALASGISKAVAGGRLSDISHAVEAVSVKAGFSVVKDFVGHGVGREMHEEPQIPNYGPPGRGPRLKAGMTLAIEPMLNLGTEEVEVLSDGWTVLTKDRKQSVHVEHTIAIMPEGPPEILTCVEKKELIQLDATVADMIDEAAFTAELGNGCRFVAFVSKGQNDVAQGLEKGSIIRVEFSPYDMRKGKILYKVESSDHESQSIS